MSTQEPSYFDLNIGEILEAWLPRHAVREVIANALDEQALTRTADIMISERDRGWVVLDYGRGFRYEHLRQDENAEKRANAPAVMGKFGFGLKDALATLHRRGIKVEIRSAHCDIVVVERAKHGFAEVPTLHAAIHVPSDPHRVGTEVFLAGLDGAEMSLAKSFFLRFSGEDVLGSTPYGDILRRREGEPGRVYVKGLCVAVEERFAFSYNVTSLTTAMEKALNRERSNVGRTAYADRVKSMLLACNAPAVAEILAAEISNRDKGTAHDEVEWMDVAVHACKILNQTKKVVFASSTELERSRDMVDHARSDGNDIVTLPENVRNKLHGLRDNAGAPVRGLDVYGKEWAKSFSYEFVEESHLTDAERALFMRRDEIVMLAGGRPPAVRKILISRTMRPEEDGRTGVVGFWEKENGRIIIQRAQLGSAKAFAGTLLHEITHARTGYPDVSRDFESALTELVGHFASAAILVPPSPHLTDSNVTTVPKPKGKSAIKAKPKGKAKSHPSATRSAAGKGRRR